MRAAMSKAPVMILALALVVRVGVIVGTPHFQPIFDAAHYDRLGAAIASGGPYAGQFVPHTPSAFRPPLYPVALALVHLLGGGWDGGRLLGAVLGVVTVLLVMLVATRIWGRRVALVAGTLVAVFPPLVALNASLLSESLFLPLVLGVLLSTLEYRRTRRLRWAVLAGVLCGLAALTRVNGLLLVVAAAAGTWGGRPRWSRRALVAPALIALVAAVTVTPWVVRNTFAFHRFVGISTQSGYALAATYNRASARLHPPGRPLQTQRLAIFRDLYNTGGGELDEGERGSRLTHSALTFAAGHPGYVAQTLLWNTLRVFDLQHDGVRYDLSFQAGYLQAIGDKRLASPVVPASVYLTVILALAGAILEALAPRGQRAPWFVWLFPVLMALPAIAVYGIPRYRSPIDPFAAMLAAVALVGLLDRLRARVGARGPAL
jgi:4-amino-4-deoxy-L-arabinose transferase-like glycosyltransferase